MANEITFTEGEGVNKPYILVYTQNYQIAAKRGLPVPKSDTTKLFFYAKKLKSDVSAWLTLDDANGGIVWTDTVNGGIQIVFGTATEGHAGDNQYFELRAKMADGTYLTFAAGVLNVLESLVDAA